MFSTIARPAITLVTTPSAAERRRSRERDLVVATRALFDERGMQDAPIDEIAKAAGIARGLVYRHFSSKEELFVLTVTDYLGELGDLLETARDSADTPTARLEAIVVAFAGYGLRYPAFLDSSLALMRRPARELREVVSDSVWLRLGQGMARCLAVLAETLRAGAQSGEFDVTDPDLMANFLWTEALGALHLARIHVGVKEAAPGVPELFDVTPDQITTRCVESALGTVGARD